MHRLSANDLAVCPLTLVLYIQMISLFGQYLDEGVDFQTLLIRRKVRIKLNENDFISAMRTQVRKKH